MKQAVKVSQINDDKSLSAQTFLTLFDMGIFEPSVMGSRGAGVTSTHNKRGMCHFDQKSSTQKSGNLPKIEPQKSGDLPEIETQKSGNPKHQAFRLHEKTYHPDQKVLDINSTFQFYLFYQRILLFNFCFMMFVQRVLNFPQTLSV